MLVDPLPVAWRFDAIGTAWRIDSRDELPAELAARVTARIEEFDRDWSRFRADSRVSRIARTAGRHELPADAGPLLELYRELHEATAGRVSPLVGTALDALGYDAGYRLEPAEPAPAPAWDAAIAWDGTHLDAAAGVRLDVGAAGKGYLVDHVSALLDAAGVPEYLVDASGDLRGRGLPDLRIALEHPGDPRRAVGVAEPGDRALCASATNRRSWGDGLHHVLDAVTGLPATRVVATWAVAPTALAADGAATALFFDVDPGFLRRREVEHARLFSDGRFEVSSQFPGEVYA